MKTAAIVPNRKVVHRMVEDSKSLPSLSVSQCFSPSTSPSAETRTGLFVLLDIFMSSQGRWEVKKRKEG